MENNLSTHFKGLVIHKPNDVRYEEVKYAYDINKPEKGYLTVKVKAAGVGPYDLGFVISEY